MQIGFADFSYHLQDDWEFFAGQPSYALAPWEPEARIDMVWRFCLLRDRNLCPNHPVKLLKTALLNTMAFLVEAWVEQSEAVLAHMYQNKPMPIKEIFGPSGVKRCSHRPLQKLRALNAMADGGTGSKETQLRTLGMHHGTHAMVRSAQLNMYKAETHAVFAKTSAVHLHLDSSCHGGKSMVCGSGHGPITESASYVQPQATKL